MPIRTLGPDDPRSVAWDWLVSHLKAACPAVEVWHEWAHEPAPAGGATKSPPPPARKSPLPPGQVGVSLAAEPEPETPYCRVPRSRGRISYRAPVLVYVETSVPGATPDLSGVVASQIAAAVAVDDAASRAAGVSSLDWAQPLVGGRDEGTFRSYGVLRLSLFLTR